LAPRIGTEGHVSFLELAPNVIAVRETVIERFNSDDREVELRGVPRIKGEEQVIDGTIETGETVCEWGRVTAVDEGELLTLAGFARSGRATTWRGVQVALEPTPVTEPGREDPAGHAFHVIADCPWGR